MIIPYLIRTLIPLDIFSACLLWGDYFIIIIYQVLKQ